MDGGAAEPGRDLWVFGYGSLIWRPGFPFREARPATLHGAHRALCVYSWVHRGTRAHPGLVLGLDHGGACRGMAFRVDPADRDAAVGYLREREQVTMVYREALRSVRVHGEPDIVTALVYVVDPNHEQYAGRLPLARQVEIVRGASGRSGANVDYVLNTVSAMRAAGISDAALFAVAEALKPSVTPRP